MNQANAGYERAVVLVPGFFGFGRLGTFSYFVDRVAAVLRGTVESRCRCAGRVPVVAVATPPSSSLEVRQRALVRALEKIDETSGGVRWFHLVGHSTGSVDAELLTCERPLDPNRSWSEIDPKGLRTRVQSVHGISSPHYGTRLVDHPMFGLLAHPLRDGKAWLEAADLAARLAGLVATRPLTLEALSASLSPSSGALPFVWRFLRHTELYADLAAEHMVQLRSTNRPATRAVIESVVCVAPATAAASRDVPAACDGFFAKLHGMTAHDGDAGPDGEDLRQAAATLQAFPAEKIIRHPQTPVPSFDFAANDGVVNSCRQLLRTRDPGAKPLAVVVADHADVIGYYDRRDSLSEGAPLEEGFFRSGAGFGDDQFFQLYDTIAESISQVIHRFGDTAVTTTPN